MGQKKRPAASLFDAVEVLETQDAQVKRRRSQNVAQSRAAASQTAIYSRLLEGRILLQRCLISDVSASLTSKTGKKQAVKECDKLLEMLLQARGQLCQKEDPPDYGAQLHDADALEETLRAEYDESREQWQQVLNRRHKDIRLQSGMTHKSQFKVVDAPFWQQVTSTVQHEQLRRGDDETTDFDDTKVYQQLLQDFVRQDPSSSAAHSKDGKIPTRLSQTTKNTVDRRASKGRKIRYTVLPKLVNFTFPVSRKADSLMDQDEWFKSLFGGDQGLNE